MKKIPLLLFLATTTIALSAQYRIADIPPALKEGADMVIRSAEMDIQIKSKSSVQIRRKYVYSILNSAADKHAEFLAHYDKLNKIQQVDGAIYDANGIKIRSIKKNEVKDYSATSEANLADDDRVKYHNFNHKNYPFTVEYETINQQEGLFHLPWWVPVIDERVAVETSNLKVTADAGYNFRFKAMNITDAPKINEIRKEKEYSWSLNNYPAIKSEAFSPGLLDILPAVLLAPSSFEMQRYSGDMQNWKDFGLFMLQLNAGRDLLPVNVQQQVQQVASAISNKREKVEALYKYMQKNTRYISIQLGIGGWQTLDANFVGKYGYGDCKALTNYMYAILKEAGITSYPALIQAGKKASNIVTDFSSNQFNHVILCVPNGKDSIWLECTSQTDAPGYLGSFTGNRKALVISPEGGTLVNTPAYTETDNVQHRNIAASINEQGMLKADINTLYYALQQDWLDGALANYSKEQLDEYMRTKFSLSYNVDRYGHKKIPGDKPGIDESVSLTSNHYASVSGKRLFVNPNLVSISSLKIKDVASRKYDFNMDDPYTDYDTVRIIIPKGYTPESVPADVDISLPHARFKSSIRIAKNEILYTRLHTQKNARIPVGKGQELADFFDKIYKSDHARIVFVKEEIPQ